MSTDKRAIAQKIEALKELQAEKQRRSQEASAVAHAATIAKRGEIPRLVLNEPDQDAQRARLLADLDGPEFWIERGIISQPQRKEEPLPIPSPPVAKSYV